MYFFLLLSLPVVLTIDSPVYCPKAAEEGNVYIFDSVTVDIFHLVIWYAKNGTSQALISECNYMKCTNHDPQNFIGFVEQKKGLKFSSSMKILTVSRTDPNSENIYAWGKSSIGPFTKIGSCDLQVFAPPEITTISPETDRAISNGTMMRFLCEANGNPRPTVAFSRQPWLGSFFTKATEVKGNTALLDVTKEMTCHDSDTYNCSASNSLGVKETKEVTIGVRCPLQMQRHITSTFESREKLKIEVPVYGYPSPYSYSLSKWTNYQSVIGICRDRYNVTYIPGMMPYGTVVLEMYQLVSCDDGSYVLYMDNGQGNGLNYTFHLMNAEPPSDETCNCQKYDTTSVTALSVITAILIITNIVFIILFVLQLRRTGGSKCQEHGQNSDTENTSYENADELPASTVELSSVSKGTKLQKAVGMIPIEITQHPTTDTRPTRSEAHMNSQQLQTNNEKKSDAFPGSTELSSDGYLILKDLNQHNDMPSRSETEINTQQPQTRTANVSNATASTNVSPGDYLILEDEYESPTIISDPSDQNTQNQSDKNENVYDVVKLEDTKKDSENDLYTDLS